MQTRRNTHPYIAVGLLSSGVFLASLDQTSVVTIIPEIMIDFGVPIGDLSVVAWVVTAYLLGFGVVMPLLGRMGDVHGHRSVFIGSVTLFGVGSVLVAISPSLEWMVAFRTIQAIGAGGMVPSSVAMIAAVIPRHGLPIALGILVASLEGGAVMGPFYGGVIADTIGWRWIFWTNIVPVVMLLLSTVRIEQTPMSKTKVGYIGGLSLALILTWMVICLDRLISEKPLSWYIFVVGVPLFLFVLCFLKHRSLKSFRGVRGFLSNYSYVAALGAHLLVGGSLIVALVTIPLMANTVFGDSPLDSGLRLMRFTGAISIGALLGGLLVKSVGVRVPAVTGLCLASLGFQLMSGIEASTDDPNLSLRLGIGGVGFGMSIVPLLSGGLKALNSENYGAGSALLLTMKMLGMTLGLTALASFGMNNFNLSAAGIFFPLPLSGNGELDFQMRVAEYELAISEIALNTFRSFFHAGSIITLTAVGLVLFIGKTPTCGDGYTTRMGL